MREVAVIICNGVPMYWHIPTDGSSTRIPDSTRLWNVIWDSRHTIEGIAHSHPGCGLPGPSMEDMTTFQAVESGLGKRLKWWITSEDTSIVIRAGNVEMLASHNEPVWMRQLRQVSNLLKGATHG